MGTLGSMIWGMTIMILLSCSAAASMRASNCAIRSALAFTVALLASIWACSSAFFASSVHFFSCPYRGPLALLSLLRSALSASLSCMALRFSASSAMASSTRGSLAFWNFLRMFSFTASGFSRTNRISSIACNLSSLMFHVKHGQNTLRAAGLALAAAGYHVSVYCFFSVYKASIRSFRSSTP